MQMQRPSRLEKEEPIDALCHHFNVQPNQIDTTNLGAALDMFVLRDAQMPTHALAVSQPDQPTAPPLMLPIDATLFEQGFRLKLNLPAVLPGTTAPVPRLTGVPQALMVSLPVVHVTVPHVSSLPLLLLYGMRLETHPNILAWSLLPVDVVEEFPNAAAMALNLSRYRDDRFERIYRHNQGLWKNILSLGLNDTRILELVQTAWNVTAEARRIRQRSSSSRH
ncbi:unnamed protein product [Cyclocybe aegerita]|uniref:Uncharacterized protein n=1 Tax=Cyclocybe aegerita TaxID=1973307 RepID=A0A8S0XMH6_CYCAE|nr:unnamed protein product [Cyclocybe aegerita]